MRHFQFLSARSVEEALGILADKGEACRVLAGGTDLLVDLREEDGRWPGLRWVLDISGLEELKGIRLDGDTVRLGALVTHAQVASHPVLAQEVGFLAEACRSVGSPQIRNRGTVAGNVVNSSPAADSLPPLVALQAEVELASLRGRRTVPLAQMLDRPYRPLLGPGELVTAIRFPRPPRGSRSCFIKVGRRRALAISRLSVAVIALDSEVRIVPGAAFPMPARAQKAEAILRGLSPDQESAKLGEMVVAAGQAAAEEMVERAGVRWSTEYKYPVLVGITRRALERVLGGGQA